MINFKEMPYTRPTVEEINNTRRAQLETLKNADNLKLVADEVLEFLSDFKMN